jgi:hypothetical protein
MVNDDVPPAKSQIEHEERRIKELQARMEELAKRVNFILWPRSHPRFTTS